MYIFLADGPRKGKPGSVYMNFHGDSKENATFGTAVTRDREIMKTEREGTIMHMPKTVWRRKKNRSGMSDVYPKYFLSFRHELRRASEKPRPSPVSIMLTYGQDLYY